MNSIMIVLNLSIVQLFGRCIEGWFHLRRILVFVLTFTFLPHLDGQSRSPMAAVHLKDGTSFNGSLVRNEKDGLLIRTKYGDLTIPGQDISSVDLTISITDYEDWDRYLDSLVEELTVSEPVLEEEVENRASDIIETYPEKNDYAETIEESAKVKTPVVDTKTVKEETPVKFTPYDTPPKPLTPIRPRYPELAQEAEIEGTVFVQVFVNDEGRVTQTKILKGVPHTGLDESATEAIRNTKFQPAIYQGKPVGVWIAIPITYRLK